MLKERVPLATLTTLKVGGEARYVAFVESEQDVHEAVTFAREHDVSFYVLGEGSNVLPSDAGYDGVVIVMRIAGMETSEEKGVVRIQGGAGVSWDAVVREAAAQNAWGIENLAGIPGTLGAAPVQNIGAYGAELAQVLEEVRVYDTTSGEVRTLSAADCTLGYRDSRFKHDASLIIIGVTLVLRTDASARLDYSDLARAKEAGEDLSTPAKIGDVVRAIRAKKFPDLSEYGTAGSFFKNPVMSEEVYSALSEKYGEAPRFPNVNGVKVPLAFILDKALGLRGFRLGPASLFGAQPLVLVAERGATAQDVDALAREVESRVYDATGITIEREVRTMPQK